MHTTIPPNPIADPITFNISYPDHPRNRTSVAFRALAAIPILVVLAALGGPAWASPRRAEGGYDA